ncbi:hypothetical protein [Burkholderia phage BCSR5]|nr:hypothetical protein [Burkholderia phage BCSR5]
MAKVQHLFTTTKGAVPPAASLLRGQLSINIPDQNVHALTPDLKVGVVSSGVQGMPNAMGSTGVHVPVDLHPVAQFAPGYTNAEIAAKFRVSGGTATLDIVPLFAFGRLWYIPKSSCPVSPIGLYYVFLDGIARSAAIGSLAAAPSHSGKIIPRLQQGSFVFQSDGAIRPWFYMQGSRGLANGTPGEQDGTVLIYRVSDVKVSGGIPVSQGFAGADATSYWGAP